MYYVLNAERLQMPGGVSGMYLLAYASPMGEQSTQAIGCESSLVYGQLVTQLVLSIYQAIIQSSFQNIEIE